MSVCSKYSSLAGLEVTEKFDLIYYSGWVGGWVAGWVGGRVAGWVAGESGIKANLSLRLS